MAWVSWTTKLLKSIAQPNDAGELLCSSWHDILVAVRQRVLSGMLMVHISPLTYLFRLYCDIQLLMRILIFHKPIYISCPVPFIQIPHHLSFWTLLPTLNSRLIALTASLSGDLWTCFCTWSLVGSNNCSPQNALCAPPDLGCPSWSYSLAPSHSD